MRPAVSDRDYGPALGEPMTINAPGRICHGERGKVISLHLATNELTIQLPGGTQYVVPWSAESLDRWPHGTTRRYRDGCSCSECCEVWASYIQSYRRRVKTTAEHGTLTRYKGGCHCPRCRAANAAWLREYRNRGKTS